MPSVLQDTLSGRARELLRIERFRGQGKLIVVHSDSGVDKTALVSETADWWTRTGMYAKVHFVSFKCDGNVLLSDLMRPILIQEERHVEKSGTSWSLLTAWRVLFWAALEKSPLLLQLREEFDHGIVH